MGTGVAFSPLEREWILRRLQEQHPSWTPDEVEEALERMNAQKLVTCPCSEHMNKKSVVVWNVLIIMRKLEDLEKRANQINDDEDPQEEEEVNELESDTNSDSGIDPDGSANPDDDTSSEKDGDEEKDIVQPCPNCGKVHPNVLFKPKPFGLLVKFTLVPKENKDEGKDKEKEEKKEEEVE